MHHGNSNAVKLESCLHACGGVNAVQLHSAWSWLLDDCYRACCMVSDLGTAQPAYWVRGIRILNDLLHEFWRHACCYLGVLHGASQPVVCIWFTFVLAAAY